MTATEIKARFPNASDSFLNRNANREGPMIVDRSEAKEMGLKPCKVDYDVPIPKTKRIRQRSKGPNKLESEWGGILVLNGCNNHVRYCAKTYVIANGLRYTPDWTCKVGACQEAAFEVKGPFSYDGALDKLKMAAAQFPEVNWILCWKEGKEWKTQRILP